jgi:hypothetical protein
LTGVLYLLWHSLGSRAIFEGYKFSEKLRINKPIGKVNCA